MMAKDLLDIGIEFLREYINATPEERQQFAHRVSTMGCSADELLEASERIREIAKTIKEE